MDQSEVYGSWKICPECRGRKEIVRPEGDTLVTVRCEHCVGGQIFIEEPAWKRRPVSWDPSVPVACPNCRRDINTQVDNFCWNCGVRLGNEVLHPVSGYLQDSFGGPTCGKCKSYDSYRRSRWGIFTWLPAKLWIWPIRRKMRLGFCHTCGASVRILIII